MERRKAKPSYTDKMPGQMYRYFIGYDEEGAPSFLKFARSVGLTTEDIESFRKKREFDRAYRECREIRRDYLIDRALQRRFDPSFVKFLLTLDAEQEPQDGEQFTIQLEVKD